jgi:hypothetical protein
MIVIFAFSLLLNNSQYVLDQLYDYRQKFDIESPKWKSIDILCYFWNKHFEIMKLNPNTKDKSHLFRDKSFFTEKIYF